LRDDFEHFRALDAIVYGVNPASAQSHQKYVDGKGFNFNLLSDPERRVARKYGALKENGTSIERTVYVVDKEGKIAFARRGMPADSEILAAIDR
jgi:peroxiredoxin Q/BCP